MSTRLPLLPITESTRRAGDAGLDSFLASTTIGRALLHHPAVTAILADVIGVLLARHGRLDRQLHGLIILRTAWVTGLGEPWMRQAREHLDLGLGAGDVSAAIAGHEGPRLDSAARAVLLAVDDVLHCGRLSDAAWDRWNRNSPSTESTIEMVVAVGIWRMVSEMLLGLGVPGTAAQGGASPERLPPQRLPTRFDGSVSARDRLAPLDPAAAGQLCRQYGMSPNLANSAVWSRLLRHPPLGAALSRQLYHLLQNGSLPARLRELVIMRIGWVTGTAYEWTRHWPHSLKAGITPEELLQLRNWHAAAFGARERAVLAATDDTVHTGRITDASWASCVSLFEPALLVELGAVIGTWHLFSQMMRSLAIPLEEGAQYWQPDGKGPYA